MTFLFRKTSEVQTNEQEHLSHPEYTAESDFSTRNYIYTVA